MKRRAAYISATVRQLHHHGFMQAIEEATCRCSPLRPQIVELDEAISREEMKLWAQLNTILGRAEDETDNIYQNTVRSAIAKELLDKRQAAYEAIARLDAVDHPKAHEIAQWALTYARVWVVEQIDAGITLPDSASELHTLYATAIAAGWKPRP